jgi:galactokinase
MAIDRYVVIAAAPAEDASATIARFTSTEVGESVEISLTDEIEPGPLAWANYVRGVLALCLQRGMARTPLDAVIHSNLPLGSGLSSSAALEVATATLMEAASGLSLSDSEKALLCQQAEHEFAGVPCGIMDQFSSVMGRENHLLLLDCRSQEVRLVPLDDPHVTVLIINSNVKHELSGGEYAERRSQCHEAARQLGVRQLRDATVDQLDKAGKALGQVLQKRARHVIGENERTVAAAEALQRRDWQTVGHLMFDSHASLRDDFQVSCRELDLLVDLARERVDKGGVIGSRMTGGGFGGCTVSLVRSEAADDAAQSILAEYEAQTGIRATAFVTRPAEGAKILEVPS